jgi:hypothetical protein
MERKQARRLPDPDRCHEGDRPGRTADGVLEREAVLAEGEVQGRALERPPAVEAGAVADRSDREEVGQAEQPRELVERAGPVHPGQVIPAPEELDLVDLVPRDVLALADVGPAAESHDDRDLGEPARRVAYEGLQLTALDDERQPGDVRVGRAGSWRGGRIGARACTSLDARRYRMSSQIGQCSSLGAARVYPYGARTASRARSHGPRLGARPPLRDPRWDAMLISVLACRPAAAPAALRAQTNGRRR